MCVCTGHASEHSLLDPLNHTHTNTHTNIQPPSSLLWVHGTLFYAMQTEVHAVLLAATAFDESRIQQSQPQQQPQQQQPQQQSQPQSRSQSPAFAPASGWCVCVFVWWIEYCRCVYVAKEVCLVGRGKVVSQ